MLALQRLSLFYSLGSDLLCHFATAFRKAAVHVVPADLTGVRLCQADFPSCCPDQSSNPRHSRFAMPPKRAAAF